MFQKLVSHNDDLRRLVERGYAVAFDSGHLLVRDIPYLDQDLALQVGTIVTKLNFIDEEKVTQVDHQIYFAGGVPYNLDGKAVPLLGGGAAQVTLSPSCGDVIVQRSFSNRPISTQRWADFFEKIEGYVTRISGPAMEKFGASPLTFRVVTEGGADAIFKFQDTLTSRAQITELRAKFEQEVVAVIGLGGTGSYLLDFLVKTPVREIRAFDLDPFHVHNAFRSPGRLEKHELGKTKAEVYAGRYENFRNGLKLIPRFIDASDASQFEGVTFAFVCVDKGSSRAEIFRLLSACGIPFIDVGMGLNKKHGPLGGMARVTYFSPTDAARVMSEGHAELTDRPDDIYKSNIQISELNALNASLALIKYKKLKGFYSEEAEKYHLLFGIGHLGISGIDEPNAV